MGVWNVDAGDIRDEVSFDYNLLYRTNQIIDFIEAQKDQIFFVTGTKGFGKTFVLKAKSINYTRDGIPLIHANILVDKPGVGSVVFDKEKLNLFKSIQNWSNLWTLSISLALVKKIKLSNNVIGYSELIDKLIELPAKNITSYFKIILTLPISDFFKAIQDLNTIVSPVIESINTPIAAFIDNVDEYFEIHIDKDKYSSSSAEGQISKDIWYLSQIGLIESIYQITQKNQHIKIFASIRKEVFAKLHQHDSKSVQYKGNSIDLIYSKEELKKIFVLNIENESKDRLVKPEVLTDDPIYSFCGVKTVTHGYVEDQTEETFDYIYRHTLQRPRDLMVIGRQISFVPCEERNPLRLKSVINDASTEIAESYLKEINQHLDYLDLNKIFSRISSNVLADRDLKDICCWYNSISRDHAHACKDCGAHHIFCSLYTVGLLGYAKEDQVQHDVRQEFLVPGTKSFDIRAKLPKSDFYLVHPCLYGIILKENPSFEPNRTVIVSPGASLKPFLDWTRPDILKKRKNSFKQFSLPGLPQHCHVHFGAGKLGLGLVVPKFIQKCRVIIIQRPSPDWARLKNCSTVQVAINDRQYIQLDIIHDLSISKGIAIILEKWKSNRHLLICSDNYELLRINLEQASSISTALGQNLKDIVGILKSCHINKDINLYPFENDKAAVDSLRDVLKRYQPRIHIIPVIADKICSERIINKDCINVIAEDFEETYVLGANKNVTEVLNEIRGLCITRGIDEQDFYYKRKFYIVNGIHMILAIYGYSYLIDKKIPKNSWKHYHLTVLMDAQDIINKMKLFIKMQSLRLLIETNHNLLKKIYITEEYNSIYENLLKYGDLTLDRFQQSIHRIISILDIEKIISLETKYKVRIEQLIESVTYNKKKIYSLGIKKPPRFEKMHTGIIELQKNASSLFLQLLKHQQSSG